MENNVKKMHANVTLWDTDDKLLGGSGFSNGIFYLTYCVELVTVPQIKISFIHTTAFQFN